MGLRFIHSADWHLDRPFIGLSHLPNTIQERIQDSTFNAMEKIIQLALRENVDFIIIAGDLFDQNHRSLKAQMRVKDAFFRLKEKNISVYLCHGNHDPLNDPSVQIDFPENVYIFGPEVNVLTHTTAEGIQANLYGFSYPERHLVEDMTPGYIKQKGAHLHIGVLHGSIKGNQEHDNYAPFVLESLIEKDFDYWALGHIHKASVLKTAPLIRYSGNIQGLSKKETGNKGVHLIEWSKDGLTDRYVETTDILWHNEKVDGTVFQDVQDMLIRLKELKSSLRENGRSVFLLLTLFGSGPLFDKLEDPDLEEEILEVLRDGEEEETCFIWPVSIHNEMIPEWTRGDLASQPSFIGELLRFSDSSNENVLDKACQPLTGHSRARKYLDELNVESKTGILREAERFIVQNLYSIQKDGQVFYED